MSVLFVPPAADATRREFLALLGASGLLAGCGVEGGSTSLAGDPATRTVVDGLGQQVQVPEVPRRIVVAGGRSLTDALVALGFRPVGVSGAEEFGDYLVQALEPFNEVENVGDAAEPNYETVTRLQPDLIIAGGDLTGAAGVGRLRQIAPTVGLDPEATQPDELETLARVLGAEDKGRQIQQDIDQRVEDLRMCLISPAPTVSLVQTYSDRLKTFLGPLTAGTRMLDNLGLQRPVGQRAEDVQGDVRAPDISLERIGELDADLIIVQRILDANTDSRQFLADLERNPLWQRLGAVEKGHVMVVSSSYWNTGGPMATKLILDDLEKALENASLLTC